jgi:hypothetical protein
VIDATSIDPMGAESEPHAISSTADPDDICPTCGRTIAQHHSSVGAAPRNPKALLCPACNLKAHQNIDVQTARLECLWRQFAQASGQIKVTQSANGTQRVKLPRADVTTVLAFGKWLESRETATPGQVDQQDTQTTSTAQRAAARAASAPPQPVSVVTAAPEPELPVSDAELVRETLGVMRPMTTEEQSAAVVRQEEAHAASLALHPEGCDDGCRVTLAPGEILDISEPDPLWVNGVFVAPQDAPADESDALDVDDMVRSTVSLDALSW